jgi:hypothetical protein
MAHSGGKIIGNVFSNGDVVGTGTITDAVIVAGSGNKLQDVTVGGDAESYTCDGASISGDLEYNSSGSNSCSVGGSVTATSTIISQVDFPISSSTLAEWKNDAEAGGVIDGGGDVTIGSNRSLGPGKITGNLVVANGKILTLNGTIWVTGTATMDNNSVVRLDAGYGALSGGLIADGSVWVRNGVLLEGTSEPSSFLILVGASSSMDSANPAMDIKNNADSAVLFVPNGLIVIHNNASLVEVVAHKLLIQKATVTYDVGLQNASFTSGPSGGWKVTSWKEIP